MCISAAVGFVDAPPEAVSGWGSFNLQKLEEEVLAGDTDPNSGLHSRVK